MPRYSSRAIGSVSSISSRCTVFAFGTGLVGDQLHAQYLGGELAGLIDRLGHLHAAAFAAASGMNLRFDNDSGRARVEQLAGRVQGIFAVLHHLSPRNGHSILRKNGLSLVLVYFHVLYYDGASHLHSRFRPL